MSIGSRNNVTYGAAGWTIFFIIVLSFFCRLGPLPLIIPLLLVFLGIHLFLFQKASIKMFLKLGLLLALTIFGARLLAEYHINSLYLPVASVGMLSVLLFNDLQLALLMSLASSVLVGLTQGGDLGMMLVFFVGSLAGAYTIQDARTRGKLIKAGAAVSFVQVVMVILEHPETSVVMSPDFFHYYLKPLGMNGILCIAFVSLTLKIFEISFGVLTNFSLLELADSNQPLLKRMILEAPGTYQHSLIVSNLSETAADAIGANALLARVGAYYHDIGKTEKPEYFTENQLLGGSKHDDIEPSISRLVILNHVTDGLDLGRKFKLNPLIMDFITQHHGTTLMHYFYQKALEEAADETEIKEEHYRYPGPKPQTKEAAIVLLADSVEAATRSLEDFNPQRIEEVVRKVINNKFIDGQLEECNLTLKEINTIATTFTRILSAMYHARVKYPEKKNGIDSSAPPQN